ncbi:DUF4974 domain-containing protein [Emticicia sp. CRIBPO]|uniref:FecR family protein n=1 Tax=Emticicia sp. CRIBPO TaxID=2683258 RepID=UPI001413697C|nr:FecR family protein [Emticicia sp. CRIBPO]NBA85531.1 DUF4974 domain-containing protein [Emticicia sp. CRIBPO]
MKNNITKDVIFNFLSGNYTSIQRKSIEQWLEDRSNEELFYQYLDEFERKHPQYPVDVEKSLSIVRSGLGQFKESPRQELSEETTGRKKWYLAGAAAALLILSLSVYTYFKKDQTAFQQLTASTKEADIIEKINGGSNLLTIILPDKSSVILQPGGKITYSTKSFSNHKREVFFEGEGFFEILKDVNSPFIVYTDDYTTKVLGTSFTLKTSRGKSENEVIVKTGKVAVYKREKEDTGSIEGLSPTILLSANQMIKFDGKSAEPLQPATTSKQDLVEKVQKMTFEFNDTPVIEVFDLLSETYHVKIEYNRETVAHCKITALLADEPLYEKIRLICFALNADFEMEEGKVRVHSKGC